MIEENLSGPGTDLVSIYEIASEGSRYAALQFRRIAYVDVNPEHDVARMQFAETVAINRGVSIRHFTTVAEAEAWLRAEIFAAE